MPVYQYEKLRKIFKEKNCVLLSSQQEVNEQTQKIPKVNFTSSCGHQSSVFVNVFISRNTGVVCKECIAKRYRDTKADTNYIEQEHHGFLKLKKYIEKDFEIQKLCDGAIVDYAIRPKGCDLYLALQIKSTNSNKNDMFSFHIQQSYRDIVIICIQVEMECFWVIDGNLQLPKKVNITYKRHSKYDEHKVSKENISQHLHNLYNNYKTHDLANINIPKSLNQQKEHHYKMMRVTKLNFLTFKEPKYEGMVYDFMISGLKFQEKITHEHGNGFCCKIAKRSGKKVQNYLKGDNDFYWIHLHDERHFYVIPESEFLKRGIVAYTPNAGAKTLILYPAETGKKHDWANVYLFEYDNPNIHQIQKVIHRDYNETAEEEMFVSMAKFWE
jgi:hypothetical protein